MTTPAIETQGLTKTYRSLAAVKNLQVSVPVGSVFGFLGRNGAGKTTTIKMLLGLARPTSGTARVLGLDIHKDSVAILERTAFVGEHKTLYDTMTPTELVRFTRAFYPRWSDASVERCARKMEIPMNQRFAKLSKGTRAKVWLLLALAQNADLMVLDEPTAGLDPVVKDEFLKMLVEEHAAEGRTVFFSSHDLSEIEQVADRVGIINAGSLLLDAQLEDLREHYRLIIASGNNLPQQRAANVPTVHSDGQFTRYLVTKDGASFVAELERQGAAITANAGVSLREVFLELVRKEDEPCISGNAGATLAQPSSFFLAQ